LDVETQHHKKECGFAAFNQHRKSVS